MFDFTFDEDTVIRELGLRDLAIDDKNHVIDGIKKQLEIQVRVRLTATMDVADFEMFNQLADADPIKAKQWLDTRFPNHDQLYQEELSDLVRELKHRGDFLVEYDQHTQGQ